MAGKFAANTQVPVERSQGAIIGEIKLMGATEHATRESAAGTDIIFRVDGHLYRIGIPPFKNTPEGQKEARRQWRVWYNFVKAIRVHKQEAKVPVAPMLVAWRMLPNGESAGPKILEALDSATTNQPLRLEFADGK
jgi:hypothetical protein